MVRARATDPRPSDPLAALFAATLPPIMAANAARAIAHQFSGFAEAVAAPLESIERAAGPEAAGILAAVRTAAAELILARVRTEPVLNNWAAVLDYLRATMARARQEELRVLFLDRQNRLIASAVMGTGSPAHCPVYPREIVRAAIMHEAAAVIISHNHPTGNTRPSSPDIEMTQQVKAALQAVDVTLHDHLIIGDAEPFSFRQEGLI